MALRATTAALDVVSSFLYSEITSDTSTLESSHVRAFYRRRSLCTCHELCSCFTISTGEATAAQMNGLAVCIQFRVYIIRMHTQGFSIFFPYFGDHCHPSTVQRQCSQQSSLWNQTPPELASYNDVVLLPSRYNRGETQPLTRRHG